MYDMATPNDHALYQAIKRKPEEERTPGERRHVDYMEGRGDGIPRFYSPVALHDH